MTEIIDNRLNKYFPKAFVYIGYALIGYGLLYLFIKILIGLGLIIIGIYLSFSFNGIQIDSKKKKFKKYSSFFGWKKGIWESYNDYPYLTMLEITEKETGYSRGQVEFTSKYKVYRVCLLNNSHREKIILKNFKNKELASKSAKEFANKLNVKLTVYSPKISEKTRLRKQKR